MSGIVPSSQPSLAERPFPFSLRWLSIRHLLCLMTLLELGWLAAIWLTGATAATHKLLPLLVVTTVLGAGAILLPDRFFEWIPLENGRIAAKETRILLLTGVTLAILLIFFASQQRVWTFDEEGNLRAATAVATAAFLLADDFDLGIQSSTRLDRLKKWLHYSVKQGKLSMWKES